MNKVFYWLIAVAFVCGTVLTVFHDRIPAEVLAVVQADRPEALRDAPAIQAVGARLFELIKAAVMDVALPLMGAMVFFLGWIKWAQKSGMMEIIAKVVRPVMVRLFPSIPPNHPAMSAIILNISANALGLTNAATPFGIKAMEELDKLNPHKGTATNAMALFLAINTGAPALLATGVMASRATLGSADPAAVIGTTLAAGVPTLICAVLVCKLVERFSPEPKPDPDWAPPPSDADDGDGYPLWVSLLAFAAMIPLVIAALYYGTRFSMWVVPVLVFGFATFAYFRGVPLYETFIEGAKEGVETTLRIIPYLVGILGVVGMLRGSGAVALFSWILGPLTRPFGLPPEAIPMVLLRPLSGSGTNGVMMSIMKEHGTDSYVGYLVSTMLGSSETTFYVLAVYFGAVGVRNIRHTLIPGLSADLFGTIFSVIAVQIYFRMNGMPL